MTTIKYEEFDPQRQNPSQNLQVFPQQNMYPSNPQPTSNYQIHQQHQNYPQGNFYIPNPPPINMPPIIQNQMPLPLNYGIPIDIRQTVRTVPTTRYSENLFCFNCQRIVPTQVTFTAGAGTWTSVLIVAMVGCLFGCCLIPFCVEDCQDAKHVCSSCGCELGKKRFLFS